jgi:hypothetical protein
LENFQNLKIYNFDSSIFLKAKRLSDFEFLRTFKELTISHGRIDKELMVWGRFFDLVS